MKRLLFVTIISIIMIILGIVGTRVLYDIFYGIFGDSQWVGILIPSLFGLLVIIGATGIFMMKKWGYVLFIAMMVLNIIGLVVNVIVNHSGIDAGYFIISALVSGVEIILAFSIYAYHLNQGK